MQNIIFDERVDKDEKDMLLDSITPQKSGLGKRELVIGFIILFVILLLSVPKIYLANEIYYLSKEIHSLQIHYNLLKNQNKQLKHEVEKLKYYFLFDKK